MNRVIILVVFIFFSTQSFAEIKSDSVAITGWLVFINDDVIFLPSQINADMKPKDFFIKNEYPDGLLVSSFIKASQYRSIATSFRIRSGTKRIKEKIKIIAVSSFSVQSIADQTDELGYLIYFRNKEINIKYQFEGPYYTKDLILLNEKDKKKIKD